MSICHRTVNHKKNLKCTLRCSNMSSTNHQLTFNPYHRPFMVKMHALSTTHPMSKITRSAISRKPVNQKKKKKVHQIHIFLHLSAHFGLTIQNSQCYRSCLNFLTSGKSALKGLANGPVVTYSKIQNRLSRPP